MKKNKTGNANTIPNFILCDTGLQFAFAQMCKNFPSENFKNEPHDWVIIDNDTGLVVSPSDSAKTQT